MGLSVTVGLEQSFVGYDDEGVEYARKSMALLSEGLATEGIVWAEPTPAPLSGNRAALDGFSYSLIHYLRRVHARIILEMPVPPVSSPDELSADDDLVDEVAMDFTSHLIYHSDCDGTYVPVDFPEPVEVDSVLTGSSQRLLAELVDCAEPLGIVLTSDGTLSDAEAARVAAVPEDHPFRMEWEVWLTLHEAARISVATGHAIVFH
ncbi:hypothetical protein GCM10009765_81760 [Fodinicola feengrottensis]|uniref:Uncharacterized protein n=1 Tax=Fodinicola feengrottensis TaxID=435914 RepID=A0ABN2JAB1_9ACTN